MSDVREIKSTEPTKEMVERAVEAYRASVDKGVDRFPGWKPREQHVIAMRVALKAALIQDKP